MAAFTPRAKMPYPALPDTPDVVRDIKALGDRVDALEGAPACTSTTRPTVDLFEGQLVFETDTGKVMRYSGTTWEPIAARAWQSYTVAWQNGAGGGGLSVGSGTLEGRYVQIGDLVFYRVLLVRASDTNLGTTYYAFTLPVSPASYQSALGSGIVGRAGSGMPVMVQGVGGTSVVLVAPSGSATTFGTRISNAAPGSWAAGDSIAFEGMYRAATAV